MAETADALRRSLETLPRADGAVGFVPTMGALHAGHASLVDRARHECAAVVVSIFVNPLQFDRHDDLERYPRTWDADLALCASRGVDVVFAPSAEHMYPESPVCTVDPGIVAAHCCGAYRPGHFRGVATVVLKLLNAVRPGIAYFGEKDAQQLAVVRAMVRDLNVPVEIVGVPTVREPDGLAVSSRNVRLNAAERRRAPALYAALSHGAASIAAGARDADAIRRDAAARIPAEPVLRLEYLDIVEPERFQPVERITAPVVLAGALWVGATRLIDNIRCEPPGTS